MTVVHGCSLEPEPPARMMPTHDAFGEDEFNGSGASYSFRKLENNRIRDGFVEILVNPRPCTVQLHCTAAASLRFDIDDKLTVREGPPPSPLLLRFASQEGECV